MACRPAPLVAFGGGGGLLRALSFTVCPFRRFFWRFFARLRCRRVFVRPCRFRAFLPRFRACFWRLRVWRCVVRFAVSILTPFLWVFRLVSARLVQSIKAIKKARFSGNFQGVFAFVHSWNVCPVEKIKKGKAVKPYPVYRLRFYKITKPFISFHPLFQIFFSSSPVLFVVLPFVAVLPL